MNAEVGIWNAEVGMRKWEGGSRIEVGGQTTGTEFKLQRLEGGRVKRKAEVSLNITLL